MGIQTTGKRKVAVFGGAIAAGVLVLSSVAYACVQSRGEIFVTGANGTSTAVGNGHHPGAAPRPNWLFCKPGKYLKAGATTFSSHASGGAGTFTVRLGTPPTDCQYLLANAKSPWITSDTVPNVFIDGDYQVNFCQGQNGQPVFGGSPLQELNTTGVNAHGSCFFNDGVTDWGVLVGTMTVTNNVAPATTFKVPFGSFPTDPGTYAAVSVRRTGPGSCNCGPPPVNLAPIALI
jgi:hypothetical protein